MTHEITEARIEAVAKSLWRLGNCPTPYDITRTILEADARWVAENSKTNDPFEVTSELLDFERQLRGKP
jgi:hypothetical protein